MRIVIVADAQKQRLALSDTVHKLGFYVLDCLDSGQLLNEALPKADVWFVDVDDYNGQMQAKIAETNPRSVVMGFRPAPHLNEVGFDRWQRNLMRRLRELLNLTIETPKTCFPKSDDWRYVLFLGASMGGVDAIKTFLDNLSPELPLAVLLAHHFDETMVDALPKILTRHNNWRCKIITTSQRLQAGTCLIAPIDKRIVCDSTGRVILGKLPWQGEYRPNIGELLKNASEVYGSQLIGIIFSGMGDDGSQHAKGLMVNQSLLWAQDPKTCQSPSQPQAFIDTGVCQFVGSPEEMAKRLSKLLLPYMSRRFDE